jgi:hypothetical protein
MDQVAYLLDEHVPPAVFKALLDAEPTIRMLAVGQPGAPPKRTPDPELLVFAETEHMALVTNDRRTMIQHAADHLASGRHTYGVFLYSLYEMSAGSLAEDLLIIWSGSPADEWIDQIVFLPL